MQQQAFDGFDVSVDNKAKLEAKFIIPPFSVLDARQGYWQERKRLWMALGIQSELGRGEGLTVGRGIDGTSTRSDVAYTEQGKTKLAERKAVGRADDLTYGDSPAMRHPTLNYYREQNKIAGATQLKHSQAVGRGDNLLGHSDTSVNIDFYAQKRKLEKELGKTLTTQEAQQELALRGRIRLVNKESKQKAARAFGEHIMRGERSYRKEADKRSNITGAPIKPEWATGTGTTNMAPGTSIFDPVLCELIYKWFCPDRGHILDPFAGGSVRGIVASVIGNDYVGIDLSQAQIEANKQQAKEITPDKQPEWIVGDSFDIETLLPQGRHYDLIFSCPPYHDLEQYTDDPSDLSNMSWGTFKDRYKAIIERCILRLNNNRFACFVVSEIRSELGDYKGLVPFTIQCFTQGGARYYNEMILVNVAGSLPIRIAGQFAYRKIGRTHQNVLVFYKGDMEQIPKTFKDIDTSFNYGGNGDAGL